MALTPAADKQGNKPAKPKDYRDTPDKSVKNPVEEKKDVKTS